MTLAEAKAMPIGQKLQVMEVLWQDLREKFEAVPVSDEIKALLDERRERVARGEAGEVGAGSRMIRISEDAFDDLNQGFLFLRDPIAGAR